MSSPVLSVEQIVLLYENLKADKGNLGSLPQKWFAYLEEIIVCRYGGIN